MSKISWGIFRKKRIGMFQNVLDWKSIAGLGLFSLWTLLRLENICQVFKNLYIDLQDIQVQIGHFGNLQHSIFFIQLKDKPILTGEAKKALLPSPRTYLCEVLLWSLVTMETKGRYRMASQHNLQCALTMNIKPNLANFVHKIKQFHGSHWDFLLIL